MVRKPQPKYGWHGQTQATGFVDEHGVTVGKRVYHYTETQCYGVVVGGPIDGLLSGNPCWLVDWDTHRGSWQHTVGTLRLLSDT